VFNSLQLSLLHALEDFCFQFEPFPVPVEHQFSPSTTMGLRFKHGFVHQHLYHYAPKMEIKDSLPFRLAWSLRVISCTASLIVPLFCPEDWTNKCRQIKVSAVVYAVAQKLINYVENTTCKLPDQALTSLVGVCTLSSTTACELPDKLVLMKSTPKTAVACPQMVGSANSGRRPGHVHRPNYCRKTLLQTFGRAWVPWLCYH